MKKIDIEEIILNQVKDELSYLDIPEMVAQFTDPSKIRAKVKANIDLAISERVTMSISESIFKAIKKHQPLIDAYTASRVESLMHKIKEVNFDD
jgi:hypothetical protein